jgi:hypothetical protein
MKQEKKGKNYAVFCFAGKKKLLFYICDVIVKQKKKKSSANHYCWRHGPGRQKKRLGYFGH